MAAARLLREVLQCVSGWAGDQSEERANRSRRNRGGRRTSKRFQTRVETLQADVIRLMEENRDLRERLRREEERGQGGDRRHERERRDDRRHDDDRGYRDQRRGSPRGNRRPREEDEYDDHERWQGRSGRPRRDYDRDDRGSGVY